MNTSLLYIVIAIDVIAVRLGGTPRGSLGVRKPITCNWALKTNHMHAPMPKPTTRTRPATVLLNRSTMTDN